MKWMHWKLYDSLRHFFEASMKHSGSYEGSYENSLKSVFVEFFPDGWYEIPSESSTNKNHFIDVLTDLRTKR